jgi:menaquinone-dependent protoporphyrinogen oxidase
MMTDRAEMIPVATKRRNVLSMTVKSVLGLLIVGSGLTFWGTRKPQLTLVRKTCSGGRSMDQRILVGYATRAGSTMEVAQAISDRLCQQGYRAEVSPIESVTSLADFQGIILGSAIRYGSWLPEMLSFIKTHQAELKRIPVAVFTLHMQALNQDSVSAANRAKYTQKVHSYLVPRAEAFFAGKIDPTSLSFFERIAVKMVKSPTGDKRDWNSIQTWADNLRKSLELAV